MAATALLNTTASLEGEEDEFPRHVVYNDLSDIWNWCYVGIAGVWLAIGVPGNFLIILSCIVFKEMRLEYRDVPGTFVSQNEKKWNRATKIILA